MMSVEVISPGLLTTVQDMGRYGYRRYGVSVGGAMDQMALRTANVLLGNAEDAACLEITLNGPTLLFRDDTLVALTGARMVAGAQASPALLPHARPLLMPRGSVLALGSAAVGCRAYLAAAGGFAAPVVLGSRSTDARAQLGGGAQQGRALQAGDLLQLGAPTPSQQRLLQLLLRQTAGEASPPTPIPVGWHADPTVSHPKEVTLRVIRGCEFSLFDDNAVTAFFTELFTVSPQSDRMGYRLTGASPLRLQIQREMISEAVTEGTIQSASDGRPILLMADAQTTGGYPRIAQVAAVDLPVAAQLRPGDVIRFHEISIMEAQQLLIWREQEFEQLKLACQAKLSIL